MSEESQQVQAAATGAAAAVAAVQDDQAEAERAAVMEASTVEATQAATEAAERAQEAAAIAEAASGESVQASQEAASAGAVASEAAEVAYSTQSDLTALRTELQERDERLIGRMREVFAETRRPNDNPTEVVVTHDQPVSGNAGNTQTANSGTDSGSSGSPANERRGRHRFGPSRSS